MKKEKILIINYEFPPLGGGGGVATYQIAKELTKTKEVHYLTSGVKNMKSYEIIDNIIIHRVKITKRKNRSTANINSMFEFTYKSIIKGIKLCKKNKFLYIWSWFVIPSGLVGLIIAKITKINHNLTIIGGDIYDPSKKMSPHKFYIIRKIINFIMNRSNKITAISSDTKKRYFKYYKNKNLKINVLPLGFIPFKYKKIKKKELEMNENKFYFITIGRLVKRKGYKYLIQAFSKMKNKNSELIFIGDGPEELELKKLAKKLKVYDKIKFIGYIKEEKKFQYLTASDCYVLSSLHEGFGIVLQEAMYCGTPIVATNNGGQVDFLKNNDNALLVPIMNSNLLSSAMNTIKSDKALRIKFRNKNKQLIKKFLINKVTQEYNKFFDKQ